MVVLITMSDKKLMKAFESLRLIPDFDNEETCSLDAINVYKYFHQYYTLDSRMRLPKKFSIESIGKSCSLWENKKQQILNSITTSGYDAMVTATHENNISVDITPQDERDCPFYDPSYDVDNQDDALFIPYKKDMYHNMMKTLEYHYIFDAGFKCVDQASPKNTYCQCPCSSWNKEWRLKHKIHLTSGDFNCDLKQKYVTPRILINHLRGYEKSDGFFHIGILRYLEELYKNYIPIIDQRNRYMDHYAIFKGDSAQRNRTKAKNELKNFHCLPFKFDFELIEEYHKTLTDKIVSKTKFSVSSITESTSTSVSLTNDADLFILDKQISPTTTAHVTTIKAHVSSEDRNSVATAKPSLDISTAVSNPN